MLDPEINKVIKLRKLSEWTQLKSHSSFLWLNCAEASIYRLAQKEKTQIIRRPVGIAGRYDFGTQHIHLWHFLMRDLISWSKDFIYIKKLPSSNFFIIVLLLIIVCKKKNIAIIVNIKYFQIMACRKSVAIFFFWIVERESSGLRTQPS